MDKRILDLNLEMSIMSHNGIVHFWKQFNPLIMGTPRHISIMDREFRMHCSNILCIILSDRFSLMTTCAASRLFQFHLLHTVLKQRLDLVICKRRSCKCCAKIFNFVVFVIFASAAISCNITILPSALHCSLMF